MKKSLTRILCLVLVICTIMTLFPATALATFGQGKHSETYDDSVVETLAETAGSREAAIEVLDQLYSVGLVDERGYTVDDPSFVVDGEELLCSELVGLVDEHDRDEAVTVDGEETTWGELADFIEVAQTLSVLLDMRDTDVEFTEEHLATYESLLRSLASGMKIDDSVQLAAVEDHEKWPETAVKEVPLDNKNDGGKNYIEVPGFGGSAQNGGYNEKYKFYQTSQLSTAAYTDSRYDGSGISHAARISLKYSKTSFAASTTADQTITVTANLSVEQPVPVSFDYRATAGSWSDVEGEGTVTWEAGETGDKTFTITINKVEKLKYNGYRIFFIQCYNVQNALFTDGKTVVDKQINVTGRASIKPASGSQTYNNVINTPDPYCWNYGEDPGIYTNTASVTLPTLDDDAKEMNLAWSLHTKYSMGMKVNASGDWGTARVGTHKMTYSCGPLNLNKTIENSYELKSGKRGFSVDQDVGSGAAYGSAMSNAVVSLSEWQQSWKWDSEYGQYNYVGYSAGIQVVFKYWDATTEVTVKNVSIPSGKFYVGQKVPIAVTYSYYLKSEDCTNMSITVNGDVLTPVETNTLGTTFTYIYTVKELDTGTPTISNFSFASQKVKGLNFSTNNYLSLKQQTFDSIPGVKNTKCSLQTPEKTESFTAWNVGCDDADPGVQTIIVDLPIDTQQDAKSNYPYISWIAANNGYDEKGTTVKLGDGTTKDVNFYVKSMYASLDGGKTRYPLWIVTTDGQIETTKPDGSPYTFTEFPQRLVANIAAPENSTADFRVDLLEIFMDPQIGSVDDYLVGSDSAKNTYKQDSLHNVYYIENEAGIAAPVAIGKAYSVYVKGVVLLENNYAYTEGGVTKTDGQDVSITYSEMWKKGYEGDNVETKTIKAKTGPLDTTDGVDVTRKVYTYYVQNEQDMILEYVIHDRYNEGDSGKQAVEYYGKEDFSFSAYKWMKWTSSDESIASVDETGYVTFTGKAGDVYFILTPLNGGNEKVQYYLYSDVIRAKVGLTPFMQINKANRDKLVLEDEDATVYFTSNIAERNQAEKGDDFKTTITAKMYKASEVTLDGSVATPNEGAQVVWEGSIQSPVLTDVTDDTGTTVQEYVPKNGITVPGDKIVKIAEGSAKDYVVIVSAKSEAGDGTNVVSAYATLQVKPAPAKPKLGKLVEGSIEKLDSYFVTSNNIPEISYQIKNAKAALQVYYTIQDSGNVNYTSDILTAASGTIDTSKFAAPSGLKNIYNISVYARNSSEDEWSVDSMTLNVYNADALQLVVTAAKSMELGGYTGGKANSDKNLIKNGKVSFEKLSLVKQLLKGDARQITIDGSEITLEMLQNDVSLQYIISINYGDYAWGLLSDQIAWKSEDHEVASVNYYQGGYYSDIESYSYPTYMPATDFVAVGLKDGKTTITATHAKNGVSQSVEVEVTRLKDQFFLFQFQPQAVTDVTYTNGNDEEIKLKTNNKGQLAVYEPSGIKSDVLAKADVGEGADMVTYAGTIQNEDLLSGEQDITSLQLYPVNNLKMRAVSVAEIFIKKPDGTAAANMEITIRGGVYKNGEYCPEAYFGTNANNFVTNQPGRKDFKGTTDENGKLKIKMDTMQFKTADPNDIPMMPGETMTYVFELRVGDGKTYAPDLFKISSVVSDELDASTPMAVFQLQTYNPAENKPVLVHQNFQLYSTAVDIGGNTILSPVSYADDVMRDTGCVGPSFNYHTVVLDSTVMYWTDKVTQYDPETGYAILPSTIKDDDSIVIKDENNKPVPGQIAVNNRKEAVTNLSQCSSISDTAMYVFPFSSMAIGRNGFKIDKESLDYNPETDDYDYLPLYQKMSIQLDINRGGKTIDNRKMPYKIINFLGVVDPESTIDSMIAQVRSQLAQKSSVGAMMSEITDVVNPVLEVPFTLISELMFDTGISKMYARIYPSNDPTVYRILIADIFDGEPVEFDNTTKVDNVAQVIEKKQAKEKENADLWYNQVISGYNKNRQSFGFALEGYSILEAKCSRDGRWVLRPVAGHIFAQLPDITIVDFTFTFPLGPIPGFVSIGVGFGTNMGYDTMEVNGTLDRIVLNTIRVYLDIGGGIGGGTPLGFLKLKLGLFFKMGMNIQFLRMFSENIHPDKTDFFGVGIQFNGEFSIRFEVGIGPLSYTHTFLRAGYDLGWLDTGYFYNIKNYSKSFNKDDFFTLYGTTLQGDDYTLMASDENNIVLEVSSARVMDRNYLQRGDREWFDDSPDFALFELNSDEENYAKKLQTNSYPRAYPVYTDDGQGMLYLTDLNVGSTPISAVAFADRSAGKTENVGPIEQYDFYVKRANTYYAKDYEGVWQLAGKTAAVSKIDLVEYNAAENYIVFKFISDDPDVDTETEFMMKDVATVSGNKMNVRVTTDTATTNYPTVGTQIDALDYNASDLVAAGTDKNYFAAWIRQTESLKKEMGATATNDDLALALNAGELVVARYNKNAAQDENPWIFDQLTDDSVPDVNPKLASSGEKAIAVWQRVGSSDDPTKFDVSNDIVYSYFDGENWSDYKTAYSCCDGSISGLDVAMLDNGKALISYVVNCGTEECDTEAFYTVVSDDVKVQDNVELAAPVTRLTTDETADTIPHAAVVKTSADGEQKFLMTWLKTETYTDDFKGSEEEKTSVRLALIDGDGKQDPTFVESIAANDNLTVNDTYKIMTSVDRMIENTYIVWKNTVNEEIDSGAPKLSEDGIEEKDQLTYDELMASKFYIDGENEGLTAQRDIARLEDNIMIDFFDGYVDENDTVQTVIFASDYNKPATSGIATLELQGLDEPVQAVLTSPESQMYTAYCKVPERGFTLSEPTFSFSEMEPGFISPMYFSFTNAGATKLASVNLVVGDQNKTYEFANGGLLPGESVNLTFEYTVPAANIADVEYSATALTAETEPVSAQWLDKPEDTTVYINCPDIGITRFAIATEGETKREFSVSLNNSSNMPLTGSNKIAKIAFYKDAEMTEQIGETDTIAASNYALIDNNAYTYHKTFNASELAELVKDEKTGNEELPSGEITIYTKVWLLNPDQSEFEEIIQSNNSAYTVFDSLLDRYRELALTEREDIALYGASTKDGENNAVLADITLQNISLGERSVELENQIGNVRAFAYDSEDKLIGQGETFDLQKPNKNDYISVGKEAKQYVSPKLTLDSEKTAEDVDYITVKLFEDRYSMLYTWENVVEPDVDKVNITGLFDADKREIETTVGDYTYADCEVSYGFTHTAGLNKKPTQGDRQFVGWFEVLGYTDGEKTYRIGEDDFTAKELAQIDFIANPNYVRILAEAPFDFENTPIEKDRVLFALFTAMIVADPEHTNTALPQSKAIKIDGRTDNAITDEIYLTLELVGDTFTEEVINGVVWDTNIDGVKVKVVERLPDSARGNNVIKVQVYGDPPTGYDGTLVILPKDGKYFTLEKPVNSIATSNLKADIKAFFKVNHHFGSTEETTVSYATVNKELDPAEYKNAYTGYHYVDGTKGAIVSKDKTTKITLEYAPNDYVIQYNPGERAIDSVTKLPIGSITGSTLQTDAKYDAETKLEECGFTYSGYKFAGWNTKQDGTGVTYAAGTKVLNLADSGSITLYAQWVEAGNASYKIEYYFQKVENGEASYVLDENKTETVSGVKANTTVNASAKSFDGYEFSAGNRLNVTAINSSAGQPIKLYYDLRKSEISFNATGTTGGSTGRYTPGTEITVPGNETIKRDGYTLISWNTVADATVSDTATSLSLTKKGYVKDNEGDFIYNSDTKKYETVTPETEKQQRYIYTDIPNTLTVPAADVIYYPVWQKNQYTVTFDANCDSGDVIAFTNDVGYTRDGNKLTITAGYGDAILIPKVTKNGSDATFLGWYDSTDSRIANPAVPTIPNGDTTYYAVWSTPYKVKYVFQDIASVGAEEPVWDTSMTEVIDLWGETGELTEAVAKTVPGFTAQDFDQQEISGEKNTVVEIKYLRKSYSVMLNYGGGHTAAAPNEGAFTAIMPYGAAITVPVLERDEYTFAGWNGIIPATVPAGNVSYTAQWAKTPYVIMGNITNLNDGANLLVELKKGNTVIASESYTVSGHEQYVNFGKFNAGIYQLTATQTVGSDSCTMNAAITANAPIGDDELSKDIVFNMAMPELNQNGEVKLDNINDAFAVNRMSEILNSNLNEGENISMSLEISGNTDSGDVTRIQQYGTSNGFTNVILFDMSLIKTTETLNVNKEVVAVTQSKVTDTDGGYVEIAVPVTGTGYVVYRIHNGVTEMVGTELSRRYENENPPHEGWFNDTENGVLYIYVNKFSTFCIGKPSSDDEKKIIIPNDLTNGSGTKKNVVNETVTVEVKPDKGYVLETLTIVDKKGQVLDYEKVGETTYKFTLKGAEATVTPTFKIRFKDVDESAYYAPAVIWAYQNDITTGIDDAQTIFNPDGITTRAQMVTFLWRAAGQPEANLAMSFTDVPADAYYAEAVRWAVAEGITKGTSDTTFSPDAEVTRAQTVTFLYRFAKAKLADGTANPFTDVDESAYYTEAVLWALGEGITKGTSDTTFAPNDTCTRGQIVTFLYRCFVK